MMFRMEELPHPGVFVEPKIYKEKRSKQKPECGLQIYEKKNQNADCKSTRKKTIVWTAMERNMEHQKSES
ncbi:uncharacterized protein LOC26526941 isoform X2 [Drosophila erecta]|uniref:uncharacterized protein LOC26526941 isoform X2 n=1 Tax=Drosophila erecta TaxID=7220 RepID=UPI000F053FE7|nr:uncharacterized protein LOC26526941 isoform X2 [Drosophila erecta]